MQVGTDTMFNELHSKLEASAEDGDRFHSLSQGLREEIERLSKEQHQWKSYNVDQLVSCMWCGCIRVLFHSLTMLPLNQVLLN